jgi:hypothetical protein
VLTVSCHAVSTGTGKAGTTSTLRIESDDESSHSKARSAQQELRPAKQERRTTHDKPHDYVVCVGRSAHQANVASSK